jgi:hypothetical protein
LTVSGSGCRRGPPFRCRIDNHLPLQEFCANSEKWLRRASELCRRCGRTKQSIELSAISPSMDGMPAKAVGGPPDKPGEITALPLPASDPPVRSGRLLNLSLLEKRLGSPNNMQPF